MILTVTLNAAIDKRYVVDDFKVGEVNRVRECSYVPGGKGLNVSKPASIYGAEVVATGFVGGHAGNYIEDALKPFGIKGEFYPSAKPAIMESPHPTVFTASIFGTIARKMPSSPTAREPSAPRETATISTPFAWIVLAASMIS